MVLVANLSQPIHSIADLVAVAKKAPGSLSFGTAGNGTPAHLTGEMFRTASQIDIRHIPYRGSAPALTDLLGGQLALMFDPLQSVFASIQGGKIKALAIASATRSALLPNVPTFMESGVPNFEATAWWAVFAPANLPTPIADRLNAEIEKIIQSPEFRNRLTPLGVQTLGGRREVLAQFQTREIAKWGKSVRDSGATID
jgi:tripartite-type tricarboxylate transporter receptor subunit TctC